MNSRMCSWNSDLIKSIFPTAEASAILSIPISQSGQKDKLIWNFNKAGIFTVKSAYHLSMATSSEHSDDRSNLRQPQGESTNWKLLWKLKLPPNIRCFAWKLLRNGLASNENLHKRIPSRINLCPRCNVAETLPHLFLYCPFAEYVWLGSPLHLQVQDYSFFSMKEFWSFLVNASSDVAQRNEKLSIAMWHLWAVWLARNALVFREDNRDPGEVLRSAKELHVEWKSSLTSQDQEGHRALAASNPDVQWHPPPLGSHKINFDGAFNIASKKGSCACVVRNNEGRVVYSIARRFSHVSSATLMEAIALREATSLAVFLRLSNTIFEGAKSIIDAMHGNNSVDYDCGVVLQDCKAKCQGLTSYSFNFVKRTCNWVAHEVAKKALSDSFFYGNTLVQISWLESRLV